MPAFFFVDRLSFSHGGRGGPFFIVGGKYLGGGAGAGGLKGAQNIGIRLCRSCGNFGDGAM